ncbi:hypothetical protein DH2020_020661 [Rehmannia glutinosa]|uniref:TPX2 C-terminal domain-containing protein n=1 Tax=Rehmannia glutinosa TaxID=99300 RepID=A0ABR0WGV2_REHGL
MAGEIEEPFRRNNFQVDSFHSGSISFGRFENEALCWERRSSFSHNRYLEEVEKCSKPGHGGDHEFTECETEVFGTSFSEPQFEFASDCTAKVDCISEHVKLDENDGAEFGSLLLIDSKSGIETKENIDGETTCLETSNVPNMVIGLFGKNNANEENSDASLKAEQSSSAKEKVSSIPEYIKPRPIPRVSVGQSRRYTSSNASNGSQNKVNKTVKNVLVRSKAEDKTSEGPSKCLMLKTPKYERSSQSKRVGEISAEKESIHRTITPQFSRSQKVITGRGYQSRNRVKPDVGSTKPGMRQDSSRLSFKSDERVERKKELRKSLNFKAIPMPSYYRGALREPDGNKATASNIKAQKLYSKSTIPGTRLSESSLSGKARTDQTICIKPATKTADPPQASGGMSCHSTVTSDSSASSHARTSKDHHQQSKAVISSVVSRTKILDKGKCTSLRKHKVPEGNHIHKGKTLDGKQKTRTGRSSIF